MNRKNLPYYLLFVLVGLFIYFAGAVLNQKHQQHFERIVNLPACEYELDNIRVIDGDTIEADILFPLGVTLRGEYIRFSDYDAWESSKRRRSVKVTDQEVSRGKRATALLREFFSDKMVVLVLDKGMRDSYGRVLGRSAVYAHDGQRTETVDFMRDNDMLRKKSNASNKKEGTAPEG